MKGILITSLTCLVYTICAQVGIGTQNPKSVFDIQSTTSGLLIPRLSASDILAMTTSADQNGMLVFATDTSGIISSTGVWYYDSTLGWKSFENNGSGGDTVSVEFYESNGTEITISGTVEKEILSESIVVSNSNGSIEVSSDLNIKSSSTLIVPELRLEIKDSSGTKVLDKLVKKGILSSSNGVWNELNINGLVTGLNIDTYSVKLYASHSDCCDSDEYSYVTGGVDTLVSMKITY